MAYRVCPQDPLDADLDGCYMFTARADITFGDDGVEDFTVIGDTLCAEHDVPVRVIPDYITYNDYIQQRHHELGQVQCLNCGGWVQQLLEGYCNSCYDYLIRTNRIVPPPQATTARSRWA